MVVLLIAGPIATMLTFTFLPGEVLSGEPARFTFDSYTTVFTEGSTYRLLLNTIFYAIGTLAIGMTLAFTLAWLMERTDLPGRSALYSLMFIPMAMPPFATAAGWILLLGPNAGVLNQWTRDLVPFLDANRGPFNIYTLYGMMFVTGLAVVPSMWLLLLGLFRNMDPSLEEAAVASGVGRWNVIRRVTFPLMRPGTMGVLVYYGIVAIEIFEIPLAIGLTAGIPVLSTKIFFLTAGATSVAPNYGLGATFGLISVLAALGMVYIYIRTLRQSARYAVVSGKGLRPRRIRLGPRLRWVALGGVAGYFVLQVALPYLVLLWSSFLRFFQMPSVEAFGNVGLKNYRLFFERDYLGQALWNTIVMMVGTATVVMLLAAIISWLVVRRPSRITKLLNVLSFIPLAIPGTVVAVGFLLLYIRTPLYGTVFILIIAMTFRFLAFTTRLTTAAQIQIDRSLEEAATSSGVSRFTTFFRINLPLMAPSLLNGWLWVAVHSIRDFTIPLFLAATSPVIANAIFDVFTEEGATGAAVPLVILVTVIMVLTFATRRWFQVGWADK